MAHSHDSWQLDDLDLPTNLLDICKFPPKLDIMVIMYHDACSCAPAASLKLILAALATGPVQHEP